MRIRDSRRAVGVRITVKLGDIFDEIVDVLISTANPELNMSGGINGEILTRGGLGIQHELWAHKQRLGKRYVDPATVVVTGPGPLTNCKHIIHAVAIDVWYKSGPELIERTVRNALNAAQELHASSVALPGLAMGYGQLPADQFAAGVRGALLGASWSIETLHIVLWKHDAAALVADTLGVPLSA